MKIQINSDNEIQVTEQRVQQWKEEAAETLARFADWVTRVEVHLTDENSGAKGGGDDIRCLIEARPADHQPVSVEVRSESPGHAFNDAIKTMKKRLDTMQDKMRTQARKGS